MTPTDILHYPRGHAHSREALDRCNAVSRAAYDDAGGERVFYSLDRAERLRLREVAKIRLAREQRYGTADALEAQERDGFVYAITHRYQNGLVKIGHARDPYKRLQQANCWCPQKLFRLHYAEMFGDRIIAEASVHKFLGGRQHYGEWFEVTPQMAVEAIQNAKQEVK